MNAWTDVSQTINETSSFILRIVQKHAEPLIDEFNAFMNARPSEELFSKRTPYFLAGFAARCEWLYQHLRETLLLNHKLEQENLALIKELNRLRSQSTN